MLFFTFMSGSSWRDPPWAFYYFTAFPVHHPFLLSPSPSFPHCTIFPLLLLPSLFIHLFISLSPRLPVCHLRAHTSLFPPASTNHRWPPFCFTLSLHPLSPALTCVSASSCTFVSILSVASRGVWMEVWLDGWKDGCVGGWVVR